MTDYHVYTIPIILGSPVKFVTEGLVVVEEVVSVLGAFVSALVGIVLIVDGDEVGVISDP